MNMPKLSLAVLLGCQNRNVQNFSRVWSLRLHSPSHAMAGRDPATPSPDQGLGDRLKAGHGEIIGLQEAKRLTPLAPEKRYRQIDWIWRQGGRGWLWGKPARKSAQPGPKIIH
jgi:hypothetical protein